MSHPADLREDAGIRVIVVEAHPEMLRAISCFLLTACEALIVGEFQNAEEALAQVPELAPDLAIVDLEVPCPDGMETIARLRAMRTSMGIIAVSVHDYPARRDAALSAGADSFLPKWELARGLEPAVSRVAKQRKLRRGGGRE